MEYPYRIPQHKARLYTLSAICAFLLLVTLPVLLQGGSSFMPDLRPFILLAFGINAVLFAAGAFQLFRQARQAEAGLVIDTVGIHDRTSPYHRTIRWDQVLDVKSEVISGSNFAVVEVEDPESFVQRAKGLIERRGLSANLKKHGTPIVIPTSNLKLPHKKIMELLAEEFLQYRALPQDLRDELKDPLPRELRKNNLL